MALEELSTTVSKLTFNIFGSESEKKVNTTTAAVDVTCARITGWDLEL